MKLTELKAKHGITLRPKYLDARWIKTYTCATPKGQRLFDLDIEKSLETGKDVITLWGTRLGKNMTMKTIAEVDDYICNSGIMNVQDKILPDEDIATYIGKQLGSRRLKLDDIKNITFIKWKSSIELHNEDRAFPYNQFREGEGHQDDNYSLGPIMMLLPDFEAWLLKHGACRKPRPKSTRSASYYD